jgi:hypothetical protein
MSVSTARTQIMLLDRWPIVQTDSTIEYEVIEHSSKRHPDEHVVFHDFMIFKDVATSSR